MIKFVVKSTKDKENINVNSVSILNVKNFQRNSFCLHQCCSMSFTNLVRSSL